MTTTFETAKVGDRVWSTEFGWGDVRGITPSEMHPLLVVFDDGNYMYYTLDGTRCLRGKTYNLYWGVVEIIAPKKPIP